MQDNGPEIRKEAEEIIEKINGAHLSDDECREIFKALKNQPEVIGGVVYTVADAQDYVAREATQEEQKSVEDYIESISVNTGVKFF
jgi:uncharacterized coiled-coil DUF342 family protein